MRTVYEGQIADAREIERRLRQGTDEIVSPLFPRVAKLCWPGKTAAELATIADVDERTAWRWLSDECDPPNCVVLATMEKIFGRKRKRR